MFTTVGRVGHHDVVRGCLFVRHIGIKISVLVDHTRKARLLEQTDHASFAVIRVVDDQFVGVFSQCDGQSLEEGGDVLIRDQRCLKMVVVIYHKIPLDFCG